jgi:fumarate reductase flavoprotein subunit
MGGIRTDHNGHSPWLQGLFAAGEAACWDMHGFNRLGGNSVAETVVAGMIVGETIADFCDSADGDYQFSSALISEAGRAQAAHLSGFCDSPGDESAFDLMRQMQETMTSQVAIFRDGDRLQQALATLQALAERSRRVRLRSSARGAAPELVSAYRLQRMLKLALCVTLGALQRTESRGAHFRADYPQRNDREWLNRTLAHWEAPEHALPGLDYESLDIAAMELPPGWRGYGARDYIPHPQAEAIEARREVAEGDAARAALQLLPPGLRGNNRRLGDRP